MYNNFYKYCTDICITSVYISVQPMYTHLYNYCTGICATSVYISEQPMYTYLYNYCTDICATSAGLPKLFMQRAKENFKHSKWASC